MERVPRSQVVPLLARTYGGYLLNRKHPNWSRHAVVEIIILLQTMESLGLVEAIKDDFLQLSLLGQACGQSNFSFRSAMNFVALLKQRSGSLTAHPLMALIQATSEVGGYTSIFKKGHKESAWQRHVTHHYEEDITSRLQRKRYLRLLCPVQTGSYPVVMDSVGMRLKRSSTNQKAFSRLVSPTD